MRKPRKGDLVSVNSRGVTYRVEETKYEQGWLILRQLNPYPDGYMRDNAFHYNASWGTQITTLACI